MLNWDLTPLMGALVEAAERMGGGGREADLYRAAASEGETGRYGDAAHFAKGLRELEDRGIFRSTWLGSAKQWWLTDEAWRDRGHASPAPGHDQAGLFA
jgi:hypothetical protein